MLGRVGGDFGRMGLVRPAGHLAGASLDLNFVASSGYPAAPSLLLTTTRSSSGDYADNSAGVWSSFAANIPRITDKGLLVEEARTNSIRNNSMQGASAPSTFPTNWFGWGLSVGITPTVVGVGTEDGIDYIDVNFAGTASATSVRYSFDATTAVAASQGQVWTESLFMRLMAGSLGTAQPQIEVRDVVSGVGGNATQGNITPTSAPLSSQRGSVTRTLADVGTTTVAPNLRIALTNGNVYNFTLRIGWPQLELGAFATSPIRTTSAAATRAADVIVGPGLTVGSALTLFTEMTAGGSTGVQGAAQVDDGGSSNRVFLWRSGTTPSGNVRDGGVDSAGLAGGTLSTGDSGKLVIAAAANDAAFSFNGGAVVTDATVTFPPGMNRLALGQNGAGFPSLNGYLRRVAYFPTRLSNSQLQALTQ